MIETLWFRYRHRKNPKVEYDVESYAKLQPVDYQFLGERCYRIRTIRNLLYSEEVHQPAYTLMPAEQFFGIYKRVS